MSDEIPVGHKFTRYIAGSKNVKEQEEFIARHDPMLLKLSKSMGEFNKKFEEPQQIELAEFQQFEPLFSKDAASRYSEYELQEIGREFYRRIDYYRPIEIIASKEDPVVLLVLPQIFAPFRSLTNVKDTAFSGVAKRIGSNDLYISRGSVGPYSQMIHDANLSDADHLEALKAVRLNTHHLELLFRKTKEAYAEQSGTTKKDSTNTSSNVSGTSLIGEVEYEEED